MVHKTIEQAAKNMETAILTIPERYRQGVRAANWKAAAASEQAEKNWKAGLAKAYASGSRKKGIGKVTNEEWQEASATKGGDVIGTRMTASLQKYKDNFGAILAKINTVADGLPPRTTDYVSNVNKRLIPIIKAMKEASGKA